jgi:hypothetical protein
MDDHNSNGQSIYEIIERGGFESDRGMRLGEEMLTCPTPDEIEHWSDLGSHYVLEVILPHSEEELACYLLPEDQRNGEGQEWMRPAYVLQGCPARVMAFHLSRHIIGRSGGEVSGHEWKQALAACRVPGRTTKCGECGTVNPPNMQSCTRCRTELLEPEEPQGQCEPQETESVNSEN